MDLKITYQVRKTILEMLEDRQYKIPSILDVNYEEFMLMYQEENYDIQDEDNKVYVYFFKEFRNFNKKDLEITVQNVKNKTDNPEIRILIILPDKLTAILEKELINPQYKDVEIFVFKDLMINITRSDEMPKFELIRAGDEVDEILKKYKLTKIQMPKILMKDPISRYYGAKSGDIFKIIRPSSSAGEYLTYRIVK